MELDSQAWGPVLVAALLLLGAWMLFGKGKKPKEQAAKERSSKEKSSSEKASSEKASKVGPADEKPRKGKAIVWTVPRVETLDDDDITVLHARPVLDEATISVEKPPPSPPNAGEENEEERVSRVELSYEEGAEAEEVTSSSARILLYAGGDSDQGRVRARNEDALLMMPERSLFAVADGMGGHRGGEIASSIAIDTLRDAFSRSDFEARVQAEDKVPRRARELAAAVQITNECVRSMALADRELHGMGTTLVAARFSPNKQRLYVGHVGDSRCYRLRRGTLRQLTTDHTMANLGMQGPHAKDLYQAVGVAQDITIDLIVDKPQEDDIYLLCSDGLSKMLSDDEVRDVLVEHEDLDAALYTLIEATNDRGGKDNVTIIIVKVLSRTSKKVLEGTPLQVSSG